MTVAEIKEFIDEHYDDDENFHTMQELRTLYGNTLDEIKSMLDELDIPQELIDEQRENYITDGVLDELELKEEWTDIEKSLECLRVEMLNLPTDFDKTVADEHLESLRYIFITQFKESDND